MHALSRIAIDPRVPAVPSPNTTGFHRPGRHCCQGEGGDGGGGGGRGMVVVVVLW